MIKRFVEWFKWTFRPYPRTVLLERSDGQYEVRRQYGRFGELSEEEDADA
jgi:hypothetical protein